MTFKSPKDADLFFQRMEKISRQIAAILGENSDAYIALQMYEKEKAKGRDVVILFTENRFVVGPRPSWDILNSGI